MATNRTEELYLYKHGISKLDLLAKYLTEKDNIRELKDSYISSDGYRLSKYRPEGWKAGTAHSNGYLVTSYGNLMHRQVAEAFIPNPKNKPEVNHKDKNTHNNHIDNLEWVTTLENINHANGNMSTRIIQLSKSGLELNSFLSLKEAEANTGIAFSNIAQVIRGTRKSAGGYLWDRKL